LPPVTSCTWSDISGCEMVRSLFSFPLHPSSECNILRKPTDVCKSQLMAGNGLLRVKYACNVNSSDKHRNRWSAAYRAGEEGIAIGLRREEDTFISIKCSDRLWGPSILLFNVMLAHSPRIKRPEREANHSPQSSTQVENAWCYTAILPHSFIRWCLINRLKPGAWFLKLWHAYPSLLVSGRGLLEKPTGPQQAKKFPTFYGTPKVHYPIHKSPLPIPTLSQIKPVHAFPSRLKIHLNIIPPSKPGSSKWSLSLRFLHQNHVRTSRPHTCYIRRPSHSYWFDHPNNIWSAVQIIKLLIMYFSPLPCYLVPLGPYILLSTLSLRSSLKMSDQVSHPHKTTGTIIVLYILIIKFLYSKLEDRLYTE
jgi:hypothetical protein